ncbi:Maf family protein [Galenea microaerophila]
MPNSPVLPLPKLILASTSPFRQQLLQKLKLPFSTARPEVDETPIAGESVEAMVERLSQLKAQAVAQTTDEPAIIIGSDQSASLAGQPLGKPHTFEKALTQLQSMQGKIIIFYTGLCVINTQTQQQFQAMDITRVHFRQLSDQALTRYLELEQPFNCAGSFKSEGLGITLFKAIETCDPNALIGLPLIELTTIFQQMGYELPLKD